MYFFIKDCILELLGKQQNTNQFTTDSHSYFFSQLYTKHSRRIKIKPTMIFIWWFSLNAIFNFVVGFGKILFQKQTTKLNLTINTNMERDQIMIIKEFLDRYESSEFDSILYDEFEQLKYLTNEIRHFNTKTTVEGERECNRKKNRYRDIIPCNSL